MHTRTAIYWSLIAGSSLICRCLSLVWREGLAEKVSPVYASSSDLYVYYGLVAFSTSGVSVTPSYPW